MFENAVEVSLWCLVALMIICIVALWIGILILIFVERRRPPAPDEHSTHYDSIGTFHAEALDHHDTKQ